MNRWSLQLRSGVALILAGGLLTPVLAADLPRRYICYVAAAPVRVDGDLSEAAWQDVPWSAPFVDIQGDLRPVPEYETRVKMLWDDANFYIAAKLEEPHLWATLTKRDSVIFHDNDFEVFIDPDGDTHNYYELEVNALATEWDLLLTKPYRDGGRAIDSWDIQGLKTRVKLDGTLNDPSDKDTGWTVEMAIPWKVLEECAAHGGAPRNGEQWRVNFSRVQWQRAVVDGRYARKKDARTGRKLPEDNWVWSPQGMINMHCPEHWGYVQFSTGRPGEEVEFVAPREEGLKQALRRLYHLQRDHRKEHGYYATDLSKPPFSQVRLPDGNGIDARLETTQSYYEITCPRTDGKGVWHIDQHGRIWSVGRD